MKLVKGLLFATALGAVFTSCNKDEEVSVVTLADSRQVGASYVTISGENEDGSTYEPKTIDLNFLQGEDNTIMVTESDSITYDYDSNNNPMKFVYATQKFEILLRQDEIFDPESELEEDNAYHNEELQEKMDQNGYLYISLHVNKFIGGTEGVTQSDIEKKLAAEGEAGVSWNTLEESFDVAIIDEVEFDLYENDGFNYWNVDKDFNTLNESPYADATPLKDQGYGITVVANSFSYDETTHKIKFQLETINEESDRPEQSEVEIAVDSEIFKNIQYSERVAQ